MNTIRSNLMERERYSPYCGNWECSKMPKTEFNGEQFKCNSCGWVSRFPENFIKKYKNKWDIK